VARSFRATGEGDAVDIRVRRERHCTLLGVTGDDRHHTRRKAGFIDQARKREHRTRRNLRRLDDNCAAGRQRGAEFCCREKHLRVPRHHRDHHADGYRCCENVHVGLVNRQHRAFDLVGKAREVAVVVGDVSRLAARLDRKLSAVSRLDLTEHLRVTLNQVGEPVEQFAARCGVETSPGGVVECALSRVYRAVDIRCVGQRKARPRLPGCGVQRLPGLPARINAAGSDRLGLAQLPLFTLGRCKRNRPNRHKVS